MEFTARLTLLHLSHILINPPSLLHLMMSRVSQSRDRRTKNAKALPAPRQEEGSPRNPRQHPIIPSCAFSSPDSLPKPNNLYDHSSHSINIGRRSPSPSDQSSRSRSPCLDVDTVEDMGQPWHLEKMTQLRVDEVGGTEWWGRSRGGQFLGMKGEGR